MRDLNCDNPYLLFTFSPYLTELDVVKGPKYFDSTMGNKIKASLRI